jgi:hypothetical protein
MMCRPLYITEAMSTNDYHVHISMNNIRKQWLHFSFSGFTLARKINKTRDA